MSTRTVPPGELEKELKSRLAASESARKPMRRARRSGGRARARFAGLLGVVALMAVGITGAFAVHDEAFQLDGNTTDADVGAAPLDGVVDWETLFDDPDLAETGPGNAPVPDLPLPVSFSEANFLEDWSLLNGAFVTSDPTTFTQSHDYEDISDWRCKLENNVTDKGDITNAYATIFNDGVSNIFYFGMEKTSVEGDNNVGIWLLQDPAAGCAGGGGGNGVAFTGNHIAGDIFLVSQFTNGGGVSEIVGYVWTDDVDPNDGDPTDPGVDPDPFVAGVDCVITGVGDSICATINTETFEPEWTHFDKSLGVNNGLESPAFFEGGIDLSAFPQFTNTCFTGFLFNTRSSQELTATLYDYAFGDIGTCEARISIGTSDTNQVGDAHTFTVTVEKNTGGGWVPVQGANVLASEAGVGTVTGGTCDNAGGDTDASGQCTIIVDSDATGQSTVNASSNVQVLNLSIPVATNGSGAHNVSNVKTWVDAQITIETSGTNKVGDPHTFTVTVEKDAGDGAGFVGASGVVIDATEAGVGTIVDESDCTDGTNASGQCLVVVDSDATGQSTVHASGTVSVGGLNIAVATDGYGAHDVSNTKTWVDAQISIGTSGTNKVGDAHTFTVTVEKDAGDGLGFVAAAGVNVLASELGVGTITGGTCDNAGGDTNASGQCTIIVDSDAVGQSTVNASATVSVGGLNIAVATDGYGANDVSNIKTWVNADISIQTSGTNLVGDPHTFTVTVRADFGDGLGLVPVEGAIVDATEAGVGSIVDESDCADGTNASGQCLVVVDSDATGQSTVHATTTIDVDGVSISLDTNGAGANIVSNVKTWVDARISIAAGGTNLVGDPHTFTVTVEKDLGDGAGFVPAAGVTVVATEDGVGAIDLAASTCDDQVTDSAGQCLVVVDSSATGESTVDATATVSVGGLNIDVDTEGYGANTVDNEKTWVDARISIVTDGLNGITEAHTFTVTVEADYGDGAGFVAVVGANVDASISGTGAITGGTCDNTGGDTDASGQCTVIVNSDDAGIGTVDASTTIDVGGVSIDLATDGYGAFTVENEKEWVDGSLTWIKHDNNGQLLGGATFRVCRTLDRFGTDIVDECVIVVDDVDGTGGAAGSGLDEDGAAGLFKLSELLLGTYTIEETVAPAGYTLDPFVDTVVLTLASPDGAAAHIWVNTTAGEGCTPGFWKNHTAAWNEFTDATVDAMPAGFEFTTSTLFNAYFGLTPAQSGFNNNVTMLGAVKAGGGGEKALARHGVSALLNVAALDGYPIQDFIDLYNDIRNAYLTNTEAELAAILAGFNNLDHQNCPTS